MEDVRDYALFREAYATYRGDGNNLNLVLARTPAGGAFFLFGFAVFETVALAFLHNVDLHALNDAVPEVKVHVKHLVADACVQAPNWDDHCICAHALVPLREEIVHIATNRRRMYIVHVC